MSAVSFHEIEIANKHYFIIISRNNILKLKKDTDSNISSVIDKISSETSSIILIFKHDVCISNDFILSGIYHAISDLIIHDVRASKNLALNALMHIFCTDQFQVLKTNVIPNGIDEDDTKIEDLDIVFIILAGEDAVKFLLNSIETFIFVSRFDDIKSVISQRPALVHLNACHPMLAKQALFSMTLQSRIQSSL